MRSIEWWHCRFFAATLWVKLLIRACYCDITVLTDFLNQQISISTYDGLASTPVYMTPISASPGRKTGRRLVPRGTSRKVVRA